MKKTLTNTIQVEGYLYEHNLKSKVTGERSKNPGTPYITGNIKIATDDAITNIITLEYTYVTASSGRGEIYTSLNKILNGTYKTYMAVGKEATKLSVSGAIGLNEFYSNRNDSFELVSVMRAEGAFIQEIASLNKDESKRNLFKCDMVIIGAKTVEGDSDSGTVDKCIVKGAVFDFRKQLLPIQLTAINPKAIEYFESLEASAKDPVFTQVWGHQVSSVIKTEKTVENAFGESLVQETVKTNKDWVITGAIPEPYEWDSEATLTDEEFKKMISDRELMLATKKSERENYQVKTQPTSVANDNVPTGAYKF